MKQVFGFLLIGLGLISLFIGLGQGTFRGGMEILGALIGILLLFVLPGVLLLRKNKKTDFFEQNK